MPEYHKMQRLTPETEAMIAGLADLLGGGYGARSKALHLLGKYGSPLVALALLDEGAADCVVQEVWTAVGERTGR